MKKNIRKLIDNLLKKVGIQTIRVYELEYLRIKHKETINELSGLLTETIFKGMNLDKKRNDLLTHLYGTSVSEAIYIVYYLKKTFDLEGDVCEFGIANGTTSALIANEIKNTKKNLWLYDSFKGLSKPTEKDILINDIFNLGSMEKYEASMSYPDTYVKDELKKINFPKIRTHIVAGFIEDTINKKIPKTVSFAYIDFDLYNPIKVTLEKLHKILSNGGYIVVDDYNYFSKGVKTAVDEFLNENKSKYKLILPRKFAGKFCIINKIS